MSNHRVLKNPMGYINRREFIRSASALSIAILSGCASMPKEDHVDFLVRPEAIQPPKDGSFVGFEGNMPSFYEDRIGAVPKIVMPHADLFIFGEIDFRRDIAEEIAEHGAYPYFKMDLNSAASKFGYVGSLPTSIGFNDNLKKYFTDTAEWGQPIFVTTMSEMNNKANSKRVWKGLDPKLAIDIYRHIVETSKKYGAHNITWVWSVQSQKGLSKWIRTPYRFYPGDDVVDWIGLSAYARTKYPPTNRSLGYLIKDIYKGMRDRYPDKPIMTCEFGKTLGNSFFNSQSKWLRNAYRTMRELPAMKASVYWDNAAPDDLHMLDNESYQVVKELRKDPYFIFAGQRFSQMGRRKLFGLMNQFANRMAIA